MKSLIVSSEFNVLMSMADHKISQAYLDQDNLFDHFTDMHPSH